MKNEKTFLKKKLPLYIKMASSVSLVVGAMGVATHTYAADAAEAQEIVITGQRASVQSAQAIKKESKVIVDSIVAEDIGKLPDRSVTEALQRVPGVTVSRYTNGDAEHPAVEGSGVAVRGLTQVRAELNGRDIFSAATGRGLSFEDVPAELMYAVDTYKSPSADMIEGGLGGTVNLRTRMPFDAPGQVGSVTLKANYGDQIKDTNGEYSALYSNRWSTNIGEVGFLVDISASELSSRSDQIYTRAYIPREVEGQDVFVPKGGDWRRNDYNRDRDGAYAALQWAPNDDTEVYFTAFRSKHQSSWDENAYFISGWNGDATPMPVAGNNDWKYDSNGSLISGTTTVADPSKFGIDFGTSTRFAENTSTTTDFSGGVKWSPDEHWQFSLDLQSVKSEAEGEDYTLGLIVFPEKVAYTNLGDVPTIATDSSYLENFNNYSLGQEMAHLNRNVAESKAFRFDAEYAFEDSIIKSVKAGARYSEKTADNHDTGYNWKTRNALWFGFDKNTVPKVTQDEASKFLQLYSFDNFQRGDTSVPTSAYLYTPEATRDFRATTDAINVGCEGWWCGGTTNPDWVVLDLDNPDNINKQKETSTALYAMVNYGFDDLPMPVDGNVGVRVVSTDNVARGNITYSKFTFPDGSMPFYNEAETFDAKNSYTHVLPSFNLRLEATDDLFIRFSASKAVWAPSFNDLQAKFALDVAMQDGKTKPETGTIPLSDLKFSLSQDSNPYLEPMQATQFDVSAEWYFDDNGGMAHLALFSKDIKDFFRKTTGANGTFERYGQTYQASWLGNYGTGDVKGAEIGFSKFFDKLPAPFDGLGLQANYTYIDSKSDVPDATKAIDTDQSTYGKMPIEFLSKDSFNIVGMYEKNGISARLAYTWRSEYLIGVGSNGFKADDQGDKSWWLPVYNDDYGQLDASIGYTFLDNYTISLEASNLTKEKTVGIMKQNNAGNNVAYVYAQDARYAVTFRAKF